MGRMVVNNQRVTLDAAIIARFNEATGSDFLPNTISSHKPLVKYIRDKYDLAPNIPQIIELNTVEELLVEYTQDKTFIETELSKKLFISLLYYGSWENGGSRIGHYYPKPWLEGDINPNAYYSVKGNGVYYKHPQALTTFLHSVGGADLSKYSYIILHILPNASGYSANSFGAVYGNETVWGKCWPPQTTQLIYQNDYSGGGHRWLPFKKDSYVDEYGNQIDKIFFTIPQSLKKDCSFNFSIKGYGAENSVHFKKATIL